jgi:uncharacterized protein YecA (UPF0149 family)
MDLQKEIEQTKKAYAKPLVLKRKIQNNDPCPCKSGLKFKYCHGRPKKGHIVARRYK